MKRRRSPFIFFSGKMIHNFSPTFVQLFSLQENYILIHPQNEDQSFFKRERCIFWDRKVQFRLLANFPLVWLLMVPFINLKWYLVERAFYVKLVLLSSKV